MPARPLASRRAALSGTLAGTAALTLVATGCDVDDLDPRPRPSADSPGPADPPDEALVREVVAAVREAASLVASASLVGAAPLTDLLAVHRAHLLLLDPSGAEVTAAPRTGRPARWLRHVVRTEQALQQRLADAALRASSGELARVLAAMSAAVAQQLVALSSTPGPGPAAQDPA